MLNILRLKFINEANESYKTKFTNLVSKIIDSDFKVTFMKVEKIGTNAKPNEFSFLISNKEKEIHARVIYACGMIKAPHYRFIITERKI